MAKKLTTVTNAPTQTSTQNAQTDKIPASKHAILDKSIISSERLAKYFDITGRALKKVKIDSDVFVDSEKSSADFLDMATRYFEDARHFEKSGDIVNAFAALNYAHGWLDAGARLGFFDVDGDNVLFTVDKEHVDDLKSRKKSGELSDGDDSKNVEIDLDANEDEDADAPAESEDE